MASSDQDTTIHQDGSAKQRLFQRDVALHYRAGCKFRAKKSNEINDRT
jgi:hypothetical protein